MGDKILFLLDRKDILLIIQNLLRIQIDILPPQAKEEEMMMMMKIYRLKEEILALETKLDGSIINKKMGKQLNKI